MKVIFLDIEGVLDVEKRKKNFWICPIKLRRLKKVVKKTNAKIVLSTTYRMFKTDKEWLKNFFIKHKIEVIDSTPILYDSLRYKEIEMWLKQNKLVKKFVIFDDDEDAGFTFFNNFFQTKRKVGLTSEIANSAIEFLNN